MPSWELTIFLSQQPFLGVSNVAFIIVSPYHCTPCLRLPCSLKVERRAFSCLWCFTVYFAIFLPKISPVMPCGIAAKSHNRPFTCRKALTGTIQPSYHVTWGNWGLLLPNSSSIRKRAQLCIFYYMFSCWTSLSFSPDPRNSPRLKTYPGHRDDTRSKQASRSMLSNPVFFDLESLFALDDIIHHLGTKHSTMWDLSHMSTVLNCASSSKIIELGWFLSLKTAQTGS